MPGQAEEGEMVQDHRDDQLADDGGHHRIGNADTRRQDEQGGHEHHAVYAAAVVDWRDRAQLGHAGQGGVANRQDEQKREHRAEEGNKRGLQGVIEAFAQVAVDGALDGNQAADAKSDQHQEEIFHRMSIRSYSIRHTRWSCWPRSIWNWSLCFFNRSAKLRQP
ncbi:hypothetical protein DESC_710115 [Desulfosarcina cetonica]|nr:hypothetical protein DESC_710115 [Desulfosarcina cetonica]